ncbi:hypothetical protein K437DRAFT_258032 [Tilletiaria anomala UBC 951]|uniref:Abscisic acid G-protein coupled receptor-like domain-containing protein n=1 Tax=Tilletiaria anomala (strain ATCC 24038 / CBS 436.72 / UBC 951) TaxID=1037660 RepID=A0A066VKR5_TILAU|nr:uncharacterized protein K437DRAFT_258032 [Tilletiaria anomala UBC 951]KDN42091.1 hypothetical protein K437DRAFT_258032 [Tilletiaria anomala UBC 951]
MVFLLLDSFIILAARLGLFIGCKTIALPLLYGQARYAALESSSSGSAALLTSNLATDTDTSDGGQSGNGLPTPATSSATRGSLPSSAAGTAWRTVASRRERQSLIAKLASQSSLVALLFSLALEEVTILFVLVLLDATGYSRRLLWANWNASLLTTIACVVVLLPLGACLLITTQGRSSSLPRRLLLSIVPYTLWLLLFLKVPLPARQAAEKVQDGLFAWLLSSALLRTAVLGVTLVALLSGSAAMAAAWDAWADLQLFRASSSSNSRNGGRRVHSRRMLVTSQDVENAQASFKRMLGDLEEKRVMVEHLEAEEVAQRSSSTSAATSSSLLGRMNPWGAGNIRVKEIKILRAEIWALEKLAQSMRDDLDALRKRERRVQWSKTWKGRLMIGIGWGFAGYCVFRIALSLLSLLTLGYRDSTPPDFISYALASLLHLFDIHADISVWARQISLLFIGVLIAMRMRAVLGYLSSAFKAASSGTSSSFLVLFLAEITVMYLLATLIQLRTSVPPVQQSPSASHVAPPPLTRDDTAGASGEQGLDAPLLSSLPSFQVVFGSLFDSAFLLSAAATGVVKWLSYSNEFESSGTLLDDRD